MGTNSIDKTFVYRFIMNNPACHLANVHNGKPHVRALFVYRADEGGILFHTSKSKDLYRQLKANQLVEICFNNYDDEVQVRVEGTVEFIEDEAVKRQIVADRDRLQPWILQAGYEQLAVLRIQNGLASVWTPETTFSPKRYIRL